MNNKASKTAVGALLITLNILLLIPTALDIFVYALPAFAGMLTMFAVIELGKGWAAAVYAGSAALALLVVPNKEAAVLYAAFFGYYPIIKALLESMRKRVVEFIIKYLVFNISFVISYLLLIYAFGLPFNELMGIEETTSFFARHAAAIFLIAGNVVFLLYDFALTQIATVYLRFWQKRFRRLFKFK